MSARSVVAPLRLVSIRVGYRPSRRPSSLIKALLFLPPLRRGIAEISTRDMSTHTLPSPLAQPTFAELFTPKLVTVLREGYSFRSFRADVMAGLTVAIVALPLSMAIAIASGVSPERGLLHRDRRRLHRLGARRQPLPDRRPGGRLHRAGGGDRGAARRRRPAPRDADGRRDPAGDRASCGSAPTSSSFPTR